MEYDESVQRLRPFTEILRSSIYWKKFHLVRTSNSIERKFIPRERKYEDDDKKPFYDFSCGDTYGMRR